MFSLYWSENIMFLSSFYSEGAVFLHHINNSHIFPPQEQKRWAETPPAADFSHFTWKQEGGRGPPPAEDLEEKISPSTKGWTETPPFPTGRWWINAACLQLIHRPERCFSLRSPHQPGCQGLPGVHEHWSWCSWDCRCLSVNNSSRGISSRQEQLTFAQKHDV